MLKGHNPDEEIVHKLKNNLTNELNKKINQSGMEHTSYSVFFNNCGLLIFNLQIEISAALWSW